MTTAVQSERASRQPLAGRASPHNGDDQCRSAIGTRPTTSAPSSCPKASDDDRPPLRTPTLPALQGNPRNAENTPEPERQAPALHARGLPPPPHTSSAG